MADETTEKIIIEVETKGVQDADKAMDGLTDSIDENKKATEENKEEQEEYNKSLGDSIKDVKIFGVSMNSLSASFKATTGALKTSTQGLKLFKVALASTGIGLLVLALGALVTFFTRSQEGADILSKSLRVIGNVINVLLDRLSDLGGGLFKLFTGDITGGLNDIKNSFTGIGGAIQENIDRGIELENQLIAIRDANLILTVEQAKTTQRIAQAREASNDLNNTLEDRIKFTKEALKQQEILALSQIGFLKIRKANLEGALAESKTRAEDLQEVADLEAEIIGKETQRALASIRIRNRLQVLEKEDIAIREANEEAAALKRKERRELQRQNESIERQEIETERISSIDTIANYELDQAQIVADGLLNLQKKQIVDANNTANTKIRINDLLNQSIGDGAQALFSGIAALAGQNSVLGQASAIAEATINTWKGVASIIGDGTIPTTTKPFFIAAAIAQGLAAVRQITSVPLPKVQVSESVFGEGGHIIGASHDSPSRGVRILGEGGEFVMNKRSMRIPGVSGLMESINSLGRTSRSYPVGSFGNGGAVPSNLETLNLQRAVQEQRSVLVLEDLHSVESSVLITDDLASL